MQMGNLKQQKRDADGGGQFYEFSKGDKAKPLGNIIDMDDYIQKQQKYEENSTNNIFAFFY